MKSRLDPTVLMGQLANADAAIDIRTLLAEVMNAFGGQEAFANEFVESVRLAEKGSATQLGALSSTMRAYLQYGHVGGDDDGADEESVLAQMRALIAEDKEETNGSESPSRVD